MSIRGPLRLAFLGVNVDKNTLICYHETQYKINVGRQENAVV